MFNGSLLTAGPIVVRHALHLLLAGGIFESDVSGWRRWPASAWALPE